MLHRVQRCLRDVDPRAIREPDLQPMAQGVSRNSSSRSRRETFQLPARSGPAQPALAGKAPETADPQSAATRARCEARRRAPAVAGVARGPAGVAGTPLAAAPRCTPEDFAALCRAEPGVWDFAQRLGAAIERFCRAVPDCPAAEVSRGLRGRVVRAGLPGTGKACGWRRRAGRRCRGNRQVPGAAGGGSRLVARLVGAGIAAGGEFPWPPNVAAGGKFARLRTVHPFSPAGLCRVLPRRRR